MPLQTLREDIDYGFSEACTTYGVIGVKVWVYKGDTLGRTDLSAAEKEAAPPPERDERRPRRPGTGRPGDRRGPGGPGGRRDADAKPDAAAPDSRPPARRGRTAGDRAPAGREGRHATTLLPTAGRLQFCKPAKELPALAEGRLLEMVQTLLIKERDAGAAAGPVKPHEYDPALDTGVGAFSYAFNNGWVPGTLNTSLKDASNAVMRM